MATFVTNRVVDSSVPLTQDKIAPITATGTLSARSLQDRFADIINVKDFGAKGDGVTDDYSAFRLAADTAEDTRQSVFVPAGQYKLSQDLLTNVTINCDAGAQFTLFNPVTLTKQSNYEQHGILQNAGGDTWQHYIAGTVGVSGSVLPITSFYVNRHWDVQLDSSRTSFAGCGGALTGHVRYGFRSSPSSRAQGTKHAVQGYVDVGHWGNNGNDVSEVCGLLFATNCHSGYANGGQNAWGVDGTIIGPDHNAAGGEGSAFGVSIYGAKYAPRTGILGQLGCNGYYGYVFNVTPYGNNTLDSKNGLTSYTWDALLALNGYNGYNDLNNPSNPLHVSDGFHINATPAADVMIQLGGRHGGQLMANRNGMIRHGINISHHTGTAVYIGQKYSSAGGLATDPGVTPYAITTHPDAGFVGIGTATPLNRLHVADPGFEVALFQATRTNESCRVNLEGNGTNGGALNAVNNFLVFQVGGNEKVRIDNSGLVGIGTPFSSYQLQLSLDSAAKPGTNTWTIASDERLKENIELADTQRCYEIVKNLPLKRYTWKNEIYSAEQVEDRSKIGWIAQDVQSVFPKGIQEKQMTFSPTGLSADNVVIENCLSLNTDQIYAAMYGAIQQLIDIIESLETRIQVLES